MKDKLVNILFFEYYFIRENLIGYKDAVNGRRLYNFLLSSHRQPIVNDQFSRVPAYTQSENEI